MTGVARALVLAAWLLAAPAVRAADDGPAWLERMSQTLASASYVGEFQLQGRGYSEQMQIVHCVRDGRISERLVSLSGPRRELVRNGDEVTAYLPDKKLAIIERRLDRNGLLGALPRYGTDLEQWYEVQLEARMPELNGRPAAVVSVRPRDGFRFGHRLWIDEATGMPVRTELLDPSGQVVERLRFTRLELRSDIPDSSLQPGVDKSKFRWVRQASHSSGEAAAWAVRQPPPGFRLSASSVRDMAGVPSPVSQLVLSDGLASVSVFIHAPAAGQQPTQGTGRAGAASTFTAVVEGQQVTAVGEVPPLTLKAIVSGVVRKQ
jgi:sigma-E factor negative regulatory protein RseB